MGRVRYTAPAGFHGQCRGCLYRQRTPLERPTSATMRIQVDDVQCSPNDLLMPPPVPPVTLHPATCADTTRASIATNACSATGSDAAR